MSEREEAEMVGQRINRDAALAEVWKSDPNWRPPASLYSTPRGYIDALRDDTRAAEERLREIESETGRAAGFVWTDGTNRRSDEEICRPNGEWIGSRWRGAGEDVRTLSTTEFKSVWQELSAGGGLLTRPGNYRGIWYGTRDGGIVGLRNSGDWGWTIDLSSGAFYRPGVGFLRFHNRRR